MKTRNSNKKAKITMAFLFVNLLIGFILIAGTSDSISNINENRLSALTSYDSAQDTTQNNTPSITDIQTDRNYFANALGIGEAELNEELIRNFSERRKSDSENMQDIIKIARFVRAEKRSKISEELLNFKRESVRRIGIFSRKNFRNAENIRVQIQKYQEILEQRKEIRLNLSNNKINEFLKNKNRNPRDFMNSLLN